MRTSFHHEKQHGFIRPVENVVLTNINAYTDGIIGYVMSDTWCQRVWQQILVAGPHTYAML